MDLRKLEYFETVARLGNFTKAAEELHVSQPSITTSIRTLEQSLGVNLLLRTKRHVHLTVEGEILYQKAVEILNDVRSTMQQMVDLGAAANKVIRVGIVPIAGSILYPILFSGFQKRNPDVRYHITESGTHGVLDALLKNQVEIGYLILPDKQDDNIVFSETMSGEIRVLLHRDNPLCRFESISFEQLACQPIINLPIHSYLRRVMDLQFNEHHVTPRVVHEPTQMITTFELVAAGLGVSFVLLDQMHMVRNNNVLVTRPMENRLRYRAGFVWNRDSYLSAICRELVDYVTTSMNGI